MNIEAVTISQNKYDVLRVFASDSVREDHFNEGAAISRFAAFAEEIEGVKIINSRSKKKTEANIMRFMSVLNSLSIRPYYVFIHGDVIEVSWYPNGWHIITSKKNYLELSLEFIKYIDSLYFCKMRVNTGSFDDDPFYKEDMKLPLKKIYNPHFTEYSFGKDADKEIELANSQYS